MRPKARRSILNEKGSMSIVTLFTLSVVIIGSVFLFYFFTVFIEKRQAQNIADASSLAAAQVLRDKFEEAMKKKAEETLDRFLNREIPTEYALLAETPLPDYEEFKKQYIEEKIGTVELASRLIHGSFIHDDDWLLIVKEPYFRGEYTAEKNGETLYDAFVRNAAVIGDAAKRVIELNHGKAEGKITFPDEGKPKLKMEAVRIIEIDNIGLKRELAAVAAAGIGSKAFDIDVRGKTPRTIQW